MSRNRSSFFDSFNSEFEKQLPAQKDYRSAFHAAEQTFTEKVGQSPYRSWESFKSQRSKRRRK